MQRSASSFSKVAVASILAALIACGDSSDDDNGGAAGATLPQAGTISAAGTTGAGTTGGAGKGGSAAPAPNMPDAMCLATEGDTPCARCACTPNAMGGCLTESNAC